MAKLKALVKAGVVNNEGYYVVGGRTAIDFANSAQRFDRDGEGLASLEDLLTFLKSQELLHEDEASAFHMYIFQNPERCQQVMDKLHDMRIRFSENLKQASEGWPIDPNFVADLNDLLATYKTKIELVPSDSGYEVKNSLVEEGPEQLLYPILKDMAVFLASDQVEKARVCASDTCELFFVNQSRNGRRRWCSMSTCGNRAKVNAYLKRKEA
ncbi:hypothetical protein GUA87_13175 [Sneathiella sp. P13V-1]|uniref:CGNR zinc finger domain-containing protein n=1 Tax=Sneathiella sp. P13V-1 TaxID=2697366 RepID=UPI00187B4F9F|nr:CGNR zinc finger domain-containing protein [Sneathiella sp. P13V-1]MBE7637801.1 hypothetical protein [Sneathiella sp. P13V-1]